MKKLIAAFRRMVRHTNRTQAQIDVSIDRVQLALDKVNAFIDSED